MNEAVFFQLSAILVLGILSQWLSWKVHLPSILILLLVGFLIGPVLGWVDPDQLFGDGLFPIVSLSVAIILFEGGLSLSYQQLRGLQKVVIRLVTVGVFLSFILISLSAYFILNLNVKIAILLGAILVVTGPTVIIPLLNHLKLKRDISQVILWEGIINDPIGATLALIVFEIILSKNFSQALLITSLSVVKTILVATLAGALGAYLLILLMKKYWLPDFLHNPVTLMVLILVFSLSNHFQDESGLLAVTLMGIFMANQKSVPIKHILEFKENLRLILISVLFIILAARLKLSDIPFGELRAFLFAGALILIIRPLVILISTLKTNLNWRERVLLFWMAPRGIVAAAVSSIFGLYLANKGIAQSTQLMSYTFLIIIGTVAFYGLTAGHVARWLKLSFLNPQGILMIGAHHWARKLAAFLKEQGYFVLMVDSNPQNVKQARTMGLNAIVGNILLESFRENLDLSGIGKLFAITSNDEVNTLACLHFLEIFGREQIYQLALPDRELMPQEDQIPDWSGRILFDRRLTFDVLAQWFEEGAELETFTLTEHFTMENLRQKYNHSLFLMFVIKESGDLEVWAEDNPPEPEKGDRIIALIRQTN